MENKQLYALANKRKVKKPSYGSNTKSKPYNLEEVFNSIRKVIVALYCKLETFLSSINNKSAKNYNYKKIKRPYRNMKEQGENGRKSFEIDYYSCSLHGGSLYQQNYGLSDNYIDMDIYIAFLLGFLLSSLTIGYISSIDYMNIPGSIIRK